MCSATVAAADSLVNFVGTGKMVSVQEFAAFKISM